MKLNITFRHFDNTPAIEERIKQKVKHLEKYFQNATEINWVCNVEGHQHLSEVNVHCGKRHFHAHAVADNLYATFDQVIAKLERQINKDKDKQIDRIHHP